MTRFRVSMLIDAKAFNVFTSRSSDSHMLALDGHTLTQSGAVFSPLTQRA